MTNIQAVFQAQQQFFADGGSLPPVIRMEKLRALRACIRRREAHILSALTDDLGKSAYEGYMCEVGLVLAELKYFLKNLPKLVAPKRVSAPLHQFPSSCRVYEEPYGVTLILSPWNYPFQLAMIPLISAVAAGNCAIVKPSVSAPATAAVIAEIIAEVFPPEYVSTVHLSGSESDELLSLPFDKIFFTGSPKVGKKVMAAAAKNLTPVVLELGGKSPCIVEKTADVPLAAKRILFGKTVNSGQTCVAPDYVLVDESLYERFIDELKKVCTELWGDAPEKRADYPRIVSRRHYERLCRLLDACDVLWGGSRDDAALKLAPAIVDGRSGCPAMEEEIFGPILPVIPYADIEDACRFIERREKPLALYLFTKDKALEQRALLRLHFGGGCVNDTLSHLTVHGLPFGGVGNSGMGNYHGEAGFRAFSHQKSVLKRGAKPDFSLRYPPFPATLGILKRFLK